MVLDVLRHFEKISVFPVVSSVTIFDFWSPLANERHVRDHSHRQSSSRGNIFANGKHPQFCQNEMAAKGANDTKLNILPSLTLCCLVSL